MWVRLVVDELIEGLCEGDSIEELKDLISSIPTELEGFYTRALRRTRRTSPLALERHRYEAYVMFQIAIYCRTPFKLHYILAAALFLATGRGTYRELQKLSLDQMERRLNSRSAGLLDVAGGGVQFIHQTVKDFMIIGKGSILIYEGISDKPRENGNLLILRYLIYTFGRFDRDSLDVDAQNFAINNFSHHAQAVEFDNKICVSDYLEPLNLLLTESQRRETFSQIVCQDHRRPWSDQFAN